VPSTSGSDDGPCAGLRTWYGVRWRITGTFVPLGTTGRHVSVERTTPSRIGTRTFS
jgi:hypothetical protein